MSASKEESLTEDELLGQMSYESSFVLSKRSILTTNRGYVSYSSSTLIFAGMDTTSNALSRILYLLATHPEVQDKLRQELAEAREDNGGEDVAYDKLVLLPYMDAICRETMRL